VFPVSRAAAVVVGRRTEIESVERFVADRHLEPSALTIVGPAGIGKTTLWQAGVAAARSHGSRVLVARPSGAEASLSFAGLVDLLEPVDDAILERLPAPQRRALAVALLREEAAAAGVDARAIATATFGVLHELAADGPLVVAVDDAQWLDEATANALRFALRRLGGDPVSVLASVRAGTGRPETFETALPEERREELRLAPLSVAAMHEVVRVRLGDTLRRPTLVRVVERSGGNAFYVLEIARELVRGGGRDDGGLPVPAGVQELVRARVARLPRRTREALLLAAALAVPTTAVVPADDLLAAEDEGLVRVDPDGRIAFEHPLVAAAIYDSVPASRRRLAHRTLAGRTDDKEERARHLALAAVGPDEIVAAELDEATLHTAARGASAAAAELARLALDLTPPEDRAARTRRALTLAHHLLDSGESAAARAVLEACDPASVEGDLRARLLRELGWILWYEGDHNAGYRLVRAALAQARDGELAARTHATAAWLLHDLDLERAIRHADAVVDRLDPEAHPGLYSWSLLLGAYLRLLNGEGADEDAYLRGCELQQRPIDWDDTSPVVAMWPLLNDRFAEARDHYERGLQRSRAEGDVTSVQGTLLRLAEIACWTGRLGEADVLAAEGMELAERTGSSAFLGSALYARALVDAHLGRCADARTAAAAIVSSFGGTLQGALGHWVLGFVELSVGDAAAADAQYAVAQRIVDTLGQREPGRFRFQPDHVEAVVELGDRERARAMVAALGERAAVFPRPWILATGERCRALLASAEGDLPGALASSEAALRHHERLEMPFERAPVRCSSRAASCGGSSRSGGPGPHWRRRPRCSQVSARRSGRRPRSTSCSGSRPVAPRRCSRRPSGVSRSSPLRGSRIRRSPRRCSSHGRRSRRISPAPTGSSASPRARSSAARSTATPARFRRELPLFGAAPQPYGRLDGRGPRHLRRGVLLARDRGGGSRGARRAHPGGRGRGTRPLSRLDPDAGGRGGAVPVRGERDRRPARRGARRRPLRTDPRDRLDDGTRVVGSLGT